MGKSGKKTKSDRINALRKQYDAFLDEDKKRKNRNEFILGRMEKMRLCTPVLKFHHMGNPQISKYGATEKIPEYFRNITRFDNQQTLLPRQTNISLDCVTTNEQILKEISRKYILIPKLRATNDNNVTYYNPPTVNDDADWRNKYNILDELKKIEKEGPPDVPTIKTYDKLSVNNDFEKREEICNTFSAQNNVDLCDQVHTIQKNNSDQAPDLQQIDEYNPICELQSNRHTSKIMPVNNTVNNIELPIESKVRLDSISQKQNLDSNKTVSEINSHDNDLKFDKGNDNENNEPLVNNRGPNTQENETKEKEHNIESKNKVEVFENTQIEPVTQISTLDFSSTQITPTNVNAILNVEENIELNLTPEEVVAHPDVTIKSQEPCDSISQGDPAPENNQQQEYEPNTEKTIITDNTITSQIDEFEAEQKEMFYPEETEYNQKVDTLAYDTQNVEYTNEQYYYNESQQDQPYYTEINEHEESTERYDPNYEQQYVNGYEGNVNDAVYVNQQYVVDNYDNHQEVTNENYEQQPNYDYVHSESNDIPDQSHTDNMKTYESQANEHVNYETQQQDNIELSEVIPSSISNEQVVYESQQDYVRMHTEQETIQKLETQLDVEEGYIEGKNTFPNESIEVQNLPDTQPPHMNTS